MKKSIKQFICFIVVLVIMPLVVEGKQYGSAIEYTETLDIVTCEYGLTKEIKKDNDKKTYYAKYNITLHPYYGYNHSNKAVEIVRWNGSKAFAGMEKNLSTDLIAAATLSCPKYMAISKDSGYKVYTFDSKSEADAKKGDKGIVLERISDYFDNVLEMQEYKDSVFKNTQLNVVEAYDYCKYKVKGDEFIEIGLSSAVSTASHYGSGYSTFDSNEKTLECPSIAYAVVHDGKTAFKFHGDWPEVCDKSGYKCFKYTQNKNRAEYGKKVKVEEVIRTATYYKSKGSGVDESDKLTIKIVGKTDGTLESVNLQINGNPTYYGLETTEAIDNYFKALLIDGSNFDDSIYCDYKEKMDKNKIVFSTTLEGNKPTNHDGLYCTSFIGFPEARYVLSGTSGGTAENTAAIIDELKKMTGSYPKKCNSSTMTESQFKSCVSKQNAFYDAAQKAANECRKLLADLSIKNDSDEYTNCETFLDKTLSKYAKAGYFGNRIITGNTSSNNCDQTLGSLGEWLTTIFKIMLLAVPVIIMIFGFKDFIKALLSGKDDELKKSGSTFIKRLIFGAVFVALPMIIKVILTIALGGDFADICIL